MLCNRNQQVKGEKNRAGKVGWTIAPCWKKISLEWIHGYNGSGYDEGK
jgi:hypothetical protein